MNNDPVWQSFDNVHRAVTELDALSRAVGELIEAGELGSVRIGTWNSDNISDEGNWLVSYYLETTSLYEGRNTLGTLSLGWSLRRNEDLHGSEWAEARTAKLYVGIAPRAKAWSTDDLFIDGSRQSPKAKADDTGLWTDPEDVGRWFFAVRLLSLCSREDLKREVVGPLRKLLRNDNSTAAFVGCVALLR
jgi:hypothetical protein